MDDWRGRDAAGNGYGNLLGLHFMYFMTISTTAAVAAPGVSQTIILD